MKWTEETVVAKLRENPYFVNFEKEFSGKFIASYFIDGVMVLVYNAVDGFAQVYFGWCYLDADIQSARQFARIAQGYIQKQINLHAYK